MQRIVRLDFSSQGCPTPKNITIAIIINLDEISFCSKKPAFILYQVFFESLFHWKCFSFLSYIYATGKSL